jgi:Holliday junction DNA helicase RuvA
VIASLAGLVATVSDDTVVIEVGGVGLAVHVTPATAAELRAGEPARLATSLVVREDSLTLYGFATDDARVVFDLLQSVAGVGPKLAQAVLAVHSPVAVRSAVTTEDLAALCLVPGIGRKSAQRLVLELKDKLGSSSIPVQGASVVALPGHTGGWRDALRSALTGLGWSPREVEEALSAVAPEAEAAIAAGGRPGVPALLKASLRGLNRV